MATVWDLYDSFCSGEQGGALPAADPRTSKPGCPEGAVVAQGEPEKTLSLANTSSLGRISWVMI